MELMLVAMEEIYSQLMNTLFNTVSLQTKPIHILEIPIIAPIMLLPQISQFKITQLLPQTIPINYKLQSPDNQLQFALKLINSNSNSIFQEFSMTPIVELLLIIAYC
jgi:hypothetical protein